MKRVNGICTVVLLAAVYMLSAQQASAECGIASTYSSGTRTANGEQYNHMGVSAAHKSLPFGTRVIVRNQRTGRSITVRINDRGPYVAGRIIDLSTGAKNALGMDGLASVCVEVVSYGSKKRGYEKPGLGARLLEAVIPGSRNRVTASARTGTRVATAERTATSRNGRKHYAEARGGGRKRYASTRHRKGTSRRSARQASIRLPRRLKLVDRPAEACPSPKT